MSDFSAVTPQSVPPGSVVVTPYQMYEEMREIGKEVREVKSILDPALANLRSDVSDNREKIESLREKMHSMERRLWGAAGFALAGGGAGGYFLNMLSGG